MNVVRIYCPATDGAYHNVVTMGGGSAGYMCTRGVVDPNYGSGYVRAKVYAGHQTAEPFPAEVDIEVRNAAWASPPYVYVPSSAGSGPYPEMSLFVWDLSSPMPYPYAIRYFYAVSAAAYDCCNRDSYRSGAAQVTVALAPVVWKLNLSGFIGPMGRALNGEHELRLRDGSGAGSRWDNGFDGINDPNIELTCDGLWRLKIRFGKAEWEYSGSAASYALGPLTLTSVNDVEVPTTLNLSPG